MAVSEVEYVSVEDIPLEVVEYEKAIFAAADDLANKPASLRKKIICDRLDKRLKEMTLLAQPYIRYPAITVDELIRLNMATLGEAIQVRRFARFSLG
ncbi:MAG TPA: hypothetical protein DDZ80_11365 [Cyanobacteria bacterium UBA8803]|nr:hypothetical protein [Cyanobacteria bacterium UBA9273]HBL59089.1 hypothetical protein [Cyanobacteria bacterium UBA8803]